MKTRIITASFLLAFLIFLIVVNNYYLNFLVLLAVLIFGVLESLKLYKIENKMILFVAIAQFLFLPILNAEAPFSDAVKISCFTLIALCSYYAFFMKKEIFQIAPLIYPTIPIMFLFELYDYFGMSHICWLILTIAACDSGAYFVGKSFGKHKFCQTSPNKTIEGVIGGVFIATIFSLIYSQIFFNYAFKDIFLMTIFVVIFGVFGDLFESYLKRKAEVKDSGNLFPGHGGMLDRIDGYLFGIIGVFLFLAW